MKNLRKTLSLVVACLAPMLIISCNKDEVAAWQKKAQDALAQAEQANSAVASLNAQIAQLKQDNAGLAESNTTLQAKLDAMPEPNTDPDSLDLSLASVKLDETFATVEPDFRALVEMLKQQLGGTPVVFFGEIEPFSRPIKIQIPTTGRTIDLTASADWEGNWTLPTTDLILEAVRGRASNAGSRNATPANSGIGGPQNRATITDGPNVETGSNVESSNPGVTIESGPNIGESPEPDTPAVIIETGPNIGESSEPDTPGVIFLPGPNIDGS